MRSSLRCMPGLTIPLVIADGRDWLSLNSGNRWGSMEKEEQHRHRKCRSGVRLEEPSWREALSSCSHLLGSCASLPEPAGPALIRSSILPRYCVRAMPGFGPRITRYPKSSLVLWLWSLPSAGGLSSGRSRCPSVLLLLLLPHADKSSIASPGFRSGPRCFPRQDLQRAPSHTRSHTTMVVVGRHLKEYYFIQTVVA